MPYVVEAFIARQEVLNKALSTLPGARLVKLPYNLGLVPNSKPLFNRSELGPGSGVPSSLWGLAEFSPEVFRWMKTASQFGPLAYLEVHFFGGIGKQVAFVMEEERITYGPLTTLRRRAEYRIVVEGESYGAVNAVLYYLGVERSGNLDEFDTIGLNRFRSTAEWDQDMARFTG